MLLDPSTWALAQRANEMLALVGDDLAGSCSAETHGAAIELSTRPHATVGEAITELGRLRAQLAGDARRLGLATAAAGMHPGEQAEDAEVPTAGATSSCTRRCAGSPAASRRSRCTCISASQTRRARFACSTGCVHISRCSWRCRPARRCGGPGDRAGLEPDDALPGLPADRAAPVLRRLCRLGAHRRPARALGRDPRADLPLVGRAASAALRHRRGSHHGRTAARGGRGALSARSCRPCADSSSRRASRTPRSCTPRRRSPRTASSPHATGWPPSSSTPSAASAYRSPICLPSSSPRRCPMPPPWAQPKSSASCPRSYRPRKRPDRRGRPPTAASALSCPTSPALQPRPAPGRRHRSADRLRSGEARLVTVIEQSTAAPPYQPRDPGGP